MNSRRTLPIAFLGLTALLAGACSGPRAPRHTLPEPEPYADIAPEARLASTFDHARGLSFAFQEVSRLVGPSVVGVHVFEQRGRGTPRRRTSQGSGVIVSEDGLVVTNNHVVIGAGERAAKLEYEAKLSDGRVVSADLIGRDPETDVAVLQLDGKGFRAATLDTFGTAQIGEWVLAMGNPLGLGHTVTVGIVGGKGRNDLGIATFEDFIQTDAAINPGNSGGPLVNLDGRVIGINTAMGTPAGGSVGIGFAIPSTMVHTVIEDILAHGSVRRGWLGVEMIVLGDVDADRLGFGGESRVAVGRVVDGSPAAEAGLTAGDVLLAVDGRLVRSSRAVLDAVAEIQPGTRVSLELWREGRRVRVPVTLGARPLAE